MSYKLSSAYALSDSQGSSQRTTGRMLVAHSTANLGASAANNASFEKRTWYSNGAYVHFIAGDGVVYQVGTPGYVAWGAGQTANILAPVQIEMAESADKAKQRRIYETYVELIRTECNLWGIPKTLDASGPTGVKSHSWVSNTYHETNHTDPYGALARIGVTKAQFAKDIAKGVTVTVAKKKPNIDWKLYVTNADVLARNTGWFEVLRDTDLYKDRAFKNKIAHLNKAIRLYAKGVTTTTLGYPCLEVYYAGTVCYMTANRAYVKLLAFKKD